METTYTPEEFAQRAGLSLFQVYTLMREGKIPLILVEDSYDPQLVHEFIPEEALEIVKTPPEGYVTVEEAIDRLGLNLTPSDLYRIGIVENFGRNMFVNESWLEGYFPPPVLTVADIAEELGVTQARVYQMFDEGKLPYVQRGHQKCVPIKDFNAYLEERKQEVVDDVMILLSRRIKKFSPILKDDILDATVEAIQTYRSTYIP